jgi:hypothetical protein
VKLIKKIYFKQKRKILNYLIHNLTYLYRPSSEPYISGDTFRKHADHIYDESKKFNPKNIKTNDIVFLSANLIEEYFINIHRDVKNRYILISHNSDRNITEKEKAYIDDRIIFWFAQNLDAKQDENNGLIPIGLENLRYQLNGVLKDFQTTENIEKSKITLLSFNVVTNNKERKKVLESLKNNRFIEKNSLGNHREYFEELKKYKFNLCPEGNGLDTHRIWESLLASAIPVMIRNTFTENLASLNFPIMLLDEWEDFNSFSIEDLNNYYKKETASKSFFDIVSYEYWLNKIKSKKKKD